LKQRRKDEQKEKENSSVNHQSIISK